MHVSDLNTGPGRMAEMTNYDRLIPGMIPAARFSVSPEDCLKHLIQKLNLLSAFSSSTNVSLDDKWTGVLLETVLRRKP